MNKDLLNTLTKEQLEKARSCRSSRELLDLAKQEGLELTEEQLQHVNGGGNCGQPDPEMCPHCQSMNTKWTYYDHSDNEIDYVCNDCGHVWKGKFR